MTEHVLAPDKSQSVMLVVMLFRKANVCAENFELVAENAARRCQNETVIMADG